MLRKRWQQEYSKRNSQRRQLNQSLRLKVKVKVYHTWYIACLWYGTHLKDYTVLRASHAFIHEWNEPYLPLPARSKLLVLIYRPQRDWRLSWLATTMVSKQSAQDCYVTEIAVISCSDRHASPSNWKRSRAWASNSRPLEPKAAKLTTQPASHRFCRGTPNSSEFRQIKSNQIWL